VVELLERAREQTSYHPLELPGGDVTPEIFDLRPYVTAYGLRTRERRGPGCFLSA
jgi:hypothetical protein